MKSIRKHLVLMLFITLIVVVIGIVSANNQLTVAYAADNSVKEYNALTINQCVEKVFGEHNKVKSYQYLYNLDESADYIYVDFIDSGYAVFNKETFEMLEYSPNGESPYQIKSSKGYYGGPTKYLHKIGKSFANISTGESFAISAGEAKKFSNQMRKLFSNYDQSKRETVTYEKGIVDWEHSSSITDESVMNRSVDKVSSPGPTQAGTLTIPSAATGTYISNANYFILAPTHGNNSDGVIAGNGNTGTCGSVAAQLLLSYNNYYNDRRIIEDRYLNGYDDLSGAISNPNNNPNHCVDPMSMTRFTLGSRSERIGSNSFYAHVVTTIMPANTRGASLTAVRNGLITILNENLLSDAYAVTYKEEKYSSLNGWSPVSSTPIKAEIDAGRPLIITMYKNLGGSDHAVVGYGYQDYTYPDGSGTYSGYVVHYGWEGSTNVWINSSWCYGYISLKMNHTHNYSANADNSELDCLTCGYRTLNFSTEANSDNTITITGLNSNSFISNNVIIPSNINGAAVTAIGTSAFANQSELATVILPSSIKTISSSAFENCTSLQNFSFIGRYQSINIPNHSTSFNNHYYTERTLNADLVPYTTYTLSFEYSDFAATTDLTSVVTSLGVGESTFAVDLPVSKSFANTTSGRQIITFTPTAEQLSTSNKLWCRFIRTYTPQSVSITIKNVKLDVGVKDVSVNAFSGCTKLATPGLKYELLSDNTYAVSSGSSSSRALFIPAVYDDAPVTQIKANGFKDCHNLRWVFMQNELTTIGSSAFKNCHNLLTVDMSRTSVTRIEAHTFDICEMETDSNHHHNIYSPLYNSCSISNMEYPPDLQYIGDYAFIRTGPPSVLPDTVTTIGDYAFAYITQRLGVRLPNNLTSIGDYAFAFSGGLIITYDDTALTTIGAHAFEGTALSANKELPDTLTVIGDYAFMNSAFSTDFAFVGHNTLTTIGNYAFYNTNLQRIVLSSTITNIGSAAFSENTALTIYTDLASKPSTWNNSWNGSNRPVVWGCTLSNDRSYVISFSKSAYSISNISGANTTTNPYRLDYNFGGWYSTADFSGTQYMDLKTAPNGTLYAKWTQQSCVAEGTLITLADGSQVAVEDLTGEENLLVWNLTTGAYDTAPILFVDSDAASNFEIIKLTFADGTELKVISEHALWDVELNKYVFLRKDAAQYIGHRFYKQSTDTYGNMTRAAVQLVDVEVYNEYTTAWSPVTYGHLCYYVNGMWSMPGATEGFINIFDVDPITLSYDEVAMAADIATYGLFTYEEFAEEIPIPEEIFYAFNGQYLKVSIGKGLIDMDGIRSLVARYTPFFTTKNATTESDLETNDNCRITTVITLDVITRMVGKHSCANHCKDKTFIAQIIILARNLFYSKL